MLFGSGGKKKQEGSEDSRSSHAASGEFDEAAAAASAGGVVYSAGAEGQAAHSDTEKEKSGHSFNIFERVAVAVGLMSSDEEPAAEPTAAATAK